jgi:hypothetical protein
MVNADVGASPARLHRARQRAMTERRGRRITFMAALLHDSVERLGDQAPGLERARCYRHAAPRAGQRHHRAWYEYIVLVKLDIRR